MEVFVVQDSGGCEKWVPMSKFALAVFFVTKFLFFAPNSEPKFAWSYDITELRFVYP